MSKRTRRPSAEPSDPQVPPSGPTPSGPTPSAPSLASSANSVSTAALIERLLQAPAVVSRLPAQVLHQVIRHCGLEACGDLVGLATPQQLLRVFDLDWWRPAAAGLDDRFDA